MDINRELAELKVLCWDTIPSYPDYELSHTGIVRRITKARGTRSGKIIAQYLSDDGYPTVGLTKEGKRKGVYVHSLVCDVVYGARPEGFQINHKDGDKCNNNPDNLEYCTISHNMKHAFSLGLCRFKDQKKELNNHWGGGEKAYSCDLCGKLFKRYERKIKLQVHKFCSLKCSWDHNRGIKVSERTAAI
jgi:hypothetical protein